MPYTITINNDSSQALAFVEYAKKLDFAEVSKNTISNDAATITPNWDEEDWGIDPEDMDFIMKISDKINHNIAKRMDKDFIC